VLKEACNLKGVSGKMEAPFLLSGIYNIRILNKKLYLFLK